jgi:hypothetical protein
MRYLDFACKDELLARFHDQLFGEEFRAELQTACDLGELRDSWNKRMLTEARRQEHWDYLVSDTAPGGREVIYGKTARGVEPIPLVPDLMVTADEMTTFSHCAKTWTVPVGMVDRCPKCRK